MSLYKDNHWNEIEVTHNIVFPQECNLRMGQMKTGQYWAVNSPPLPQMFPFCFLWELLSFTLQLSSVEYSVVKDLDSPHCTFMTLYLQICSFDQLHRFPTCTLSPSSVWIWDFVLLDFTYKEISFCFFSFFLFSFFFFLLFLFLYKEILSPCFSVWFISH